MTIRLLVTARAYTLPPQPHMSVSMNPGRTLLLFVEVRIGGGQYRNRSVHLTPVQLLSMSRPEPEQILVVGKVVVRIVRPSPDLRVLQEGSVREKERRCEEGKREKGEERAATFWFSLIFLSSAAEESSSHLMEISSRAVTVLRRSSSLELRKELLPDLALPAGESDEWEHKTTTP